ncbi:MAG TPA: cytochrome P450 [Pseudonocardia sp.]|jgi:cytochrome P450|nr:cytochrome P450 [Pseudonocardia sp.]
MSGTIGGRDHFRDFDLDSPEFTEHYDEVLDALLEECPVARSEAFGGYWVVARAEDFKRCAVDYKTFTSTRGFEPARGNEGDGGMKLYPLQIDPPYQTRWRATLGAFFNAKAITELETSVREHADYLIDQFIESGECDFVDTFAAQLPARVFFGSFLGVPFDQIKPIQKATDDAIRGPGEGRAAGWAAVGEFLDNYLKQRMDEPARGDFVDVVLEGVEGEDGEPAPWDHKVFVMVDLLAGGIGTTSHTLASLAHHLATHSDHVKRLIAEPELHDNAVEEVIRIYAPVTALGRTATTDTEVAGQPIKAGDLVMLSEGAACRDPRVTDNPSVVDLDRRVKQNLAFSYGPHRCIGAHVARMVMRVALGQLLQRMSDLAVAPGDSPTFSNSGVARNMDTLPLVFTPGRVVG